MINGRKCLLLAIQCLVLLIGSLVVYVIVEQRDYLSGEVADKISEGWGRSQRIDGPLIISQTDCETRYYPQNFDCQAQLKTQTLHKGIYTAVVYTTDLNLSSHYDELFIVGYPREVSIEIELDVTYIKRLGKLVVNGKEYDWDKTTYSITRNFKPGELAGAVDISTSLTLTGSHQLKIVQIGDRSKIVISGDAKDPSFIGKLSPLRREVTDNTFEAEWVSEDITPSRRESARYDFAGVDVLTGLDCYKKVARCLKYAILIILFTYCSVMFTEIVTRKNVPLLNYFLIGVALIIFYTLLLSFAEWMPFFWAYLIASVMVIGLISIYMAKITNSKRVRWIIGVILVVIYTGCYVMLVSSTYALLLGSLALFAALSVMMYASLRMKNN